MKNEIIVGSFSITDAEKKALDGRYNTIEVSIRYTLGGYGGLDWTYRPRGYQLVITPYQDGGGFRETSIGYGPSAGGFITLEEAKRKSQKRMQEIAGSVDMAMIKKAYVEHKPDLYGQAVKALHD